MYSIQMQPTQTPYRCRLCGATSYRRMTHRSPDGAMTYAGLYRCSGCSVLFSDPAEWRHSASTMPSAQMPPEEPAPAPCVAPSRPTSGATPGQVDPDAYGYNEADFKTIQEAAARATKSRGRRR